MQNQLAGLGQGKAPKSKKAKDVSKASSKKKSIPASIQRVQKVAPAPKSKPKKQKPVTYEEKQEISTAVEKMDGGQIERLTQIITENCEKYRNMGDEMELEIDDLPDDVQRLLLKHVRGIFGNPNRGSSIRAPSPDDLAAADDDDFEPSHRSRGGSGGGDPKRKKHKPMGKKEQQDSINILRNQLAAFNGGRPSGSVSPATANHAAAGRGGDDESSSDEESEEE
jgi:bromodomain-containing factor 1